MAASLELPRFCPATHRSSHATSLADPFWIRQDWHSSEMPAHSSLNGFEEENAERSLYYQPKQCAIIREIPENRQKFLVFDSRRLLITIIVIIIVDFPLMECLCLLITIIVRIIVDLASSVLLDSHSSHGALDGVGNGLATCLGGGGGTIRGFLGGTILGLIVI